MSALAKCWQAHEDCQRKINEHFTGPTDESGGAMESAMLIEEASWYRAVLAGHAPASLPKYWSRMCKPHILAVLVEQGAKSRALIQ